MACLDTDDLEPFLAGSGESALRRRIESHLSVCPACRALADDIADNLRLLGVMREVLRGSGAPGEPHLPERIGSYRVLREIGRGGMGIVYLAEQAQPRRTVALKLMRVDLASPAALRRFQREADLLAQLQHPGIAQIFEAGSVDQPDGPRPWFAMEYVEGLPLLEHARSRALDTEQKLQLFCRICDAVDHAHCKGVLHRDLKPANILVVDAAGAAPAGAPADAAPHDDIGQPKVLDFGVARATAADQTLAITQRTEPGQLIGTVPYMSPEQVGGDLSRLDAQSDVYALGVILYELLADRLPYRLLDRSLPEAARIIREEDPTPLGTINRSFRGDVEAIVNKALEKEKPRRYPSAAALANDIRRHLCDEPILARPSDTLYQLARFARRHRALVGGTVVAFALLVAGTTISTWQALRAARAERAAAQQLVAAQEARARAEANEARALHEAAKSDEVTRILQDMLAAPDPTVSPGRPDITVREVLDATADRLADPQFVREPEIEAAVRFTLGNTYRALGLLEPAETHLRAALDLRLRMHGERHLDTAQSMNKLARVLSAGAQYEEAETLLRRALAIRRELLGAEHRDVAVLLNNLGDLLRERGNYAEAEPLLRNALEMRRRLLGDEHPEVATSLNNLAIVLINQARHAEAEAMLRDSLAIDQKLRGELHPHVATTMSNLATVLQNQNRLEDAEPLMREVLERRERTLGSQHPDTAMALNNLALLKKQMGDFDEAQQYYRRAIDISRTALGDDHPETVGTQSNLAYLLMDSGDHEQAEQLFRHCLDVQRRILGDAHRNTLGTINGLAIVYFEQKRYVEAAALLAAATAAARESMSPTHPGRWYFLQFHGRALALSGRFAEAEAQYNEAWALAAQNFAADDSRTRRTVIGFVELYEKWGRLDAAAQWKARLPAPEPQPPAPITPTSATAPSR